MSKKPNNQQPKPATKPAITSPSSGIGPLAATVDNANAANENTNNNNENGPPNAMNKPESKPQPEANQPIPANPAKPDVLEMVTDTVADNLADALERSEEREATTVAIERNGNPDGPVCSGATIDVNLEKFGRFKTMFPANLGKAVKKKVAELRKKFPNDANIGKMEHFILNDGLNKAQRSSVTAIACQRLKQRSGMVVDTDNIDAASTVFTKLVVNNPKSGKLSKRQRLMMQ